VKHVCDRTFGREAWGRSARINSGGTGSKCSVVLTGYKLSDPLRWVIRFAVEALRKKGRGCVGGWPSEAGSIKYEKGIRWMPWRREAMKDVIRCDKLWGAANRP
jgi:hypothetical protein